MIFIIIAVVMAVISGVISRNIIAAAISFILGWLFSWLFLPTSLFGFYGMPFLLFASGAIGLIAVAIVSEYESDRDNWGISSGLIVVCVGVFFLVVVPFLTSFSGLHYGSYRSLIQPEEGEFASDIAPLDNSMIRTVDQGLARKLADKKLGEDPGLGSRVEVGSLNIQEYKGQLWWVGPLNHSGFFKWWNKLEGTPGYVMVSAHDERDVRLVLRDGKGDAMALKHNAGAYWGDKPDRYLYEHGYAAVPFTDRTFEIRDSDGRPFWVYTRYEKKVGYAGLDAIGVILLDVQTGEITKHSIDDAPEWVDRIQPEDFVVTQLNDNGKFQKGWWNSWLAQEGVIKTTPGMSIVYGKDGEKYFYTGMTSAGADDGTIGFVLVNTRTKEAKRYLQAGATETAAMRSAQGAVQEKGYCATFPVFYSVDGIPSYFLTLKDAEGLVKAYAWVNVEDYNTLGIGMNSSLMEAERSYKRALRTKGTSTSLSATANRKEVSSVVLRTEMNWNTLTRYLVLVDVRDRAFVIPADLSSEVIMTREGDQVYIDYEENGLALVDVLSFDNLALEFRKTEAQRKVEKRMNETNESKLLERREKNAEAAFEQLSPEEKAKLLNK
jgi:hypothetical protein